jgi:hypothetical protein
MTVRYTAIRRHGRSRPPDVDRNAERWRDKIEVRLDNRQVFFLFFGSAVVACMLFVLGVMVGKRIESRGQAASPDLQDPLGALDRAHAPAAVAVPPMPPLTFPNTLITSSPKPAKPAKLALAATAPAPRSRAEAGARRRARRAEAGARRGPAQADRARGGATAAQGDGADACSAEAARGDGAGRRSREDEGEVHPSPQHVHDRSGSEGVRRAISGCVRRGGATFPGRGMSYRVRYGNFPSYKTRRPPRTASRSSTARSPSSPRAD